MLRRTHFDDVPVKPQRVYEEMNRAFGRDTRYVSTIGLSQIAGGQFLHVFKPRHWINAGQAGPLGWTLPAALGVCVADPDATVVALSGDYDFQFMLEEMAVGAQFHLPYIHVVVNNSYLGLIRQSQRGFEMDYCVQLSFDNVNTPGARRLRRRPRQGRRGPGLQGDAGRPARGPGVGVRAGAQADGGVPRAGARRGAPRAGHEHRHGHRAGQRRRVRGARDAGRARARRPSPCSTESELERAVHVVVAPDKFKGIAHRARGRRPGRGRHRRRASPRRATVVRRCPVADGGDGTVDAALAAGYERVPVRADGPDRRRRSTPPTPCATGVAVVEMADVSGLRLLPPDRLAPLTATSYGTGEVVARRAGPGLPQRRAGHRRQREHGRRRGHAGGARRAAARRRRGPSCPAAAARWPTSTASTCPACTRRLAGARMVVASDVDNPLLGPHGAAAVYGPQKGATRTTSRARRGAGALGRRRRRRAPAAPDVRDRPGAGAAGGVGYAAMAVLGARAGAGDRAGARPRPVRRPPARGAAGDHRRGVARRADPARQGPGRGAPRPPRRPGSRSSPSRAGSPWTGAHCRRRASPPPTPSPTSSPTCSAAWPTPARC